MTMDARKQRVLQAIVALYGLEGEPVGSSVLANYFDMAVSSATLRNEMAALTKLGLLEQPHTSAGRVPSAKGYRYYLDNLLTDDQPLDRVTRARVEAVFASLDHEPEKLAFYSKATTDFEFLFPFGWGELWGIADRTDYDLTQHQNHSGKSLEYLDPVTNERYIPYCIEPSLGVDRMVLAFLCNAYEEQELEGGDVRTVLHLHPALAPYKAAVLPLQKNKLGALASEIHADLAKYFPVDYDETGSIGKRYRRQDEIGTPFTICVDFDTEATQSVTVRDRDTMLQERVALKDLRSYIEERMRF